MGIVVGQVPAATVGEHIPANRPYAAPMATGGDSIAMRHLRDAVETSGLPQKAVAGPRTVKQFNKLLNGVQAFPVAALDDLPDDICDDFLIRYGTARGLLVRRATREEDLARLAEELVEATRRVNDMTAAHLRRLGGR